MLNKIRFDLRFNRKVVVERDNEELVHYTDYISPGGYEITDKGKNICFDFEDCYWNRDDQKMDTIHYCAESLDVDAYPESVKITPGTIRSGKFIDFFIYTEDDANLIPLEVSDVVFEFDNSEVYLSNVQIEEINNIISATNSLLELMYVKE